MSLIRNMAIVSRVSILSLVGSIIGVIFRLPLIAKVHFLVVFAISIWLQSLILRNWSKSAFIADIGLLIYFAGMMLFIVLVEVNIDLYLYYVGFGLVFYVFGNYYLYLKGHYIK